MPSTYTTNGGIELPANGEQSGTWGETVNDNMSIIDRLTNGVGSISLSGTTHTLTTTDGTLSDGQYNVLVLGGSPSGTNTITISPNDGEHVYIVKNISGQTATFTQGSGASISVLNNTTKIIYADGAGAGAAVVDITGALDLGSLIIAGTTTITAVLDEDNMASDSATALATQQSIKAYVDSQVGTVDTLAEILAIGNTTGGTDIVASTTDKVQFRDAAIYINSSVDGQLDIVADTEIQIAATTVDVNGALDVSGTALVTGVLTTTAATVSNGGGQFNGTVTVGVDDTGYDVKFFGATTGKSLLWDESADSLIITGSTSLQGGLEVGVDDTGYDVKFFGATAGAYMLWDESADDLILGGAAGLSVNTITDASGGSTASINGLTPQASNMQPFNRIINGAMIIDQRNAGASFTPINTQYTVDRWWTWLSQSSKLTAQQNAGAVLPPAGFATYLGITSSSAYSVAASDYFALVHPVEAINFYDLDWGKATAKPATLSFWVYSSLTGTFGGALANSAQDRSYPFTYSISVADTWEYKTVTIEGDTGGTWLGATNGIGVRLQFGLGVGADNSQTAGSWYGSTSVYQPQAQHQ
jgi:hypothetical protein